MHFQAAVLQKVCPTDLLGGSGHRRKGVFKWALFWVVLSAFPSFRAHTGAERAETTAVASAGCTLAQVQALAPHKAVVSFTAMHL